MAVALHPSKQVDGNIQLSRKLNRKVKRLSDSQQCAAFILHSQRQHPNFCNCCWGIGVGCHFFISTLTDPNIEL